MFIFSGRDHQPKIENFYEDILPAYSDFNFRRCVRVPRSVFAYLLDTLSVHVSDPPHFGGRTAVSAGKKIAMFLKFLGSKATNLDIAQTFDVTESTFIKGRRQVCSAILHHVLPSTIKWPTLHEMQEISNSVDLSGQHRFPNAIGFLDGSHIPIWRPHVVNSDAYYNRKNFFSVVLQGVCMDDMTFSDVSVGCPGRMHDARVLKNSTLWTSGYTKCVQGRYHLLADAAYPLTKWIMTPYRNNGHLTQRQVHYNTALSSKRQVIERAFGILKKRFPKLRLGIDLVDVDEINDVIMAACVLHNTCLRHGDGHDFPEEDFNPCLQNPGNLVIPCNRSLEGKVKRIAITNNL